MKCVSYIKRIAYQVKCQWCFGTVGGVSKPFAIVTAGYCICRKCAKQEGKRLLKLANEIETNRKEVAK